MLCISFYRFDYDLLVIFLSLWLYAIRHFYNTNFLYDVMYIIHVYDVLVFSLWDRIFMRM